MPTYLIHGFRWTRPAIRIHIIIHDLEEATPEWLMASATSISMLNSFYSLYDFLPPSSPPSASYPKLAPESTNENVPIPQKTLTKKRSKLDNKKSIASLRDLARKHKPSNSNLRSNGNGNGSGSGKNSLESSSEGGRPTLSTATSTSSTKPPEPKFNDWSVVKLLEQYDPDDMTTVSQPYAYVADYMIEVKLGASLSGEMFKYEADQRAEEAILNAHNGSGSGSGTPRSPGDMGEQMAWLSVRDKRRRSRRLGWFEKLRDGLDKQAEIGWFVVVCGDEERMVYGMDAGSEEQSEEERPIRTPRSAGLRGFFSRKKDIQEEEDCDY